MQFINPIYLLSDVSNKVNEIGDISSSTIPRKVFAHIQSIKQSEFYQASALGLKPELTFIIRKFEYMGEKKVKYNETEFDVLRTYDKGDGHIELVCAGDIHANS
ncbi:phage head closure protein [Clostridium sp.]|uniref:phage head closure protein n=1 Tax=Clostridium sp. TaxID=1506 RepID=UPI00290E00A7|nr:MULTISPECIES: phage head closure protein [Clostridium]MDU4725925.1 phage head closure protein [Clostridium sp.]MDY4721515.1 phage head closure protein [Clostridium paraputrificum]